MIPTALDRQYVWVVDEEPKDGGLAVIERDGGLLIKRVHFDGERVHCLSVNQDPRFKPIVINRKKENVQLKRVVGTWWY